MTTPLDLPAIRARAEAATPGPWCDHTCKKEHEHGRATRKDGPFIAHARTDIPALLDALEEKTAEVERLRRLLRLVPTTGEVSLGLLHQIGAALSEKP